eukprot:3895207-Lingulodinium_polyedra.AAC.1
MCTHTVNSGWPHRRPASSLAISPSLLTPRKGVGYAPTRSITSQGPPALQVRSLKGYFGAFLMTPPRLAAFLSARFSAFDR